MTREAIIEITGVHKTFKSVHAVRGLTTKIFQGEFVALLGPNGAGKTTLIEMIEGLQKPDTGEIRLLGKNWENNEQYLHANIGLSLQETKFIDKLNVRETLLLFASFYKLGKQRVEEILQIVNLKEKQNSYVVNLSGGQRQRLALGIALLNKPKILLLDEPTTGLDPAARRDIWDILIHLKTSADTSMILTTHYMEEAEYLCDRILIMDQGNILAEGTLEELIVSYGLGDSISFRLSGNIGEEDLRSIPGFKNLIWEERSFHGKLIVDQSGPFISRLIHTIEQQGLNIIELQTRRTTLDDLFLQLTGRKLQEDLS